jgi:hypothetical protein
LEKRRTQAVYTRRAGESATNDGLGILDAAAIDRVFEEAWPSATNADKLHEALLLLGVMTEDDAIRCHPEAMTLLQSLASENRAPFGDIDRRRRHKIISSIEHAGRWSLLRRPKQHNGKMPNRARMEPMLRWKNSPMFCCAAMASCSGGCWSVNL